MTRLIHGLRRLTLVAVLLTGALFGLARLLLPALIGHYQPEIEQAVGQALGRPVTIEGISARMQGHQPQLRLHGVRLPTRGAQVPTLRLPEVQVDIALESLTAGRLILDAVALIDARLNLRRLPDGGWRLLGINDQPLSGDQADQEGIGLEQLPLAFGLVNGEIRLHAAPDREPLQLREVNLRLRREDDGLSVQGRLRVAGEGANLLEAGLRIEGPIDDPARWWGRFHLRGSALALSTVLTPWMDPGMEELAGQATLELWGVLEEGRLTRLEGGLELDRLSLRRQVAGQSRHYAIDRLHGLFRWQRGEGGWKLQLVDLELWRNELRWPSSGLTLQVWTRDGRLLRSEARASFLRLEDILSIASLLPPAPGDWLLTALERVQPAGDLRDIDFSSNGDGDTIQWNLSGSARQVRIRAWQGIPAIDNLSASFRANQGGGIARLDNQDVTILFDNGLFPGPLRARQLAGEVHWQRFPEGWQFGSSDILLNSPDFDSHTRFSFSLPDEGLPYLDFLTRMDKGDVTYARNYLPVGIMQPRVVQWLGRAMVAGRVQNGVALFHGPLRDFPFDERPSGQFEAVLRVEDVTLDYAPGWPRLEHANADLRFINNSFLAEVQSADVSASRVRQASISIDRLHPASPLEIDGLIEGLLSDDLRMLTDSPLAADFGNLADGVQGEGETRLQLKILQPLGKEDRRATQISGVLGFLGNGLRVDKWKLALSDTQGELQFSQDGVTAKGISANALGGALRIDLATEAGAPRLSRVDARGRYAIKTLADQWLGQPLPMLQGAADWHLRLDIPHSEEASTELRLASDLRGVKIDLPAPLGKGAAEKQALLIELNPGQIGKALPLHIRLGELLDARLELSAKQALDRGEVRLGGGAAAAPERPGLALLGRLGQVQLDPWLTLLDKAGTRSADGAPPLPRIDLLFDRLRLQALSLERIRVQGSPLGEGWQALLDGPQIKGLLNLPADLKRGPVELELEHLAYDSDKSPKEPAAGRGDGDPRQLPAIRLSSRQLLLNGQNLGSLQFNARKGPQGLVLEQVKLSSNWLNFSGKGGWLRAQDNASCNLVFQLETNDMAKLVQAMGGAASLRSKKTVIEGDLTWPGSPGAFNDMRLSGSLDLRLDKGSAAELDPGAGRLFGLLNLGALQRRLSLDFSDLYGKGFAFDGVRGRFSLRQGKAETNDLVIDAPTGVIRIFGDTDLVRRSYDQRVEVTPDVTGTLATAGAIAAGPVVGAALFVANKVIGKELNKVGTVRYRLTGPWDNPKVLREGQAEAPVKEQGKPDKKPGKTSAKPAAFLDH